MDKDTDEYLDEWEELIDSIDKTDIPLGVVNRIIFISDDLEIESDGPANEIDVEALRKIGYTDDLIQEVINQVMNEVQNYDCTLDFILDIDNIVEKVQPITDEYLKRM